VQTCNVGLSQRPPNLLRRRTQYAMPRSEKKLPTSSSFYASCAVSDDQFRHPCTIRSLSLACCHGLTTTMLCRWAYQPTCTVSAQRCRTIHRWPTTLRPYHRDTRQFPLVEGSRACSVQAGVTPCSWSPLPQLLSFARRTLARSTQG